MCDPGWMGFNTQTGTSAHGGSYRAESTLDDDRITYTPAAGYIGVDTFPITGEPGTTSPGTVTITVTGPTITVSPTTLSAATVGSAYSATITASGGTAPYTFAISAGALPAGLTLSSAGTLSGTPTAGGSFSFTVRATDSSSFTGTRAYVLTVSAPTLSVSPTTLSAATVATAYSATITAGGGTAPYTFAITSGSLPAGLTLSSSGTLSGTPTAGGSFNLTITATDSSTGTGPYTGSRAYSLTVNTPSILIAPTSLPAGSFGTAYSQAVTASGGTAAYTYAVTAGALPTGLSLSSGGALTGTPSTSGSFNLTITATDSSSGTGPYTGSRAYSLSIAAPAVTVSPSTLSAASVGSAYSASISASGGTAPYSIVVTAGALPAGLSLSGGTLSGTPSAGGSFNFTVTATDSSSGAGPYSGSRAYALTVNAPTVTVSPTSLPAGSFGSAYSQTITASGGTAIYSYAITAGALPSGLSLSSGGALTGTPSDSGSHNFTITATDSSSGTGPYTGSRAYSLSIAAPTVTVSPSSLSAADVGSAYSASIVASGGTAPYSVVLSAGALPAGLSLSSNGTLSGTPTAGGSFNFTVTATDSSGGAGPYSGARAYALTVNAATVTVSPTSLPAGSFGTAYSQTIAASGGTAAYTYAVTAGALPAGLSLSSGGALTGTPSDSGSFNLTISATDSSSGSGPFSGWRAYTLSIAAPTVAVSPSSLSAATVGSVYSASIVASGGTAPYSVGVSAGALPAGLSLSSTGVLSGTPTAGGSFSFTVTATDSSSGAGPYSGSRAYSLTVGAPVIGVSPTSLPSGSFGAAYHQTITASGGTAAYSYAVTAGALPTGLSLSSTGVLSGTPHTSGSFAFTVTATDSSTGSGPFSGARAYNLSIGAPTVVVSPSSLSAATVGSAYSASLGASGGTAPYAYAVTAGSLPAGLTLSSAGTLAGTPTAGGSFAFTIGATDASGSPGPYVGTRAYSLSVAAPAVTVAPGPLPGGTYGVAYSRTLAASGGTPTYTYAVSAGALPAGLTLSSAGTLGGTPSTSGSFAFTVTATDSSTGSGPYSGSRAFTLGIGAPTVVVAAATLPPAGVGVAYSSSFTASGGAAPYAYAVTAGALPAGLSLTSTGTLAGTPTSGGSFGFTVGASDASGSPGPYSGTRAFTLNVGTPAVTVSPASLAAASYGSPYSQVFSASGGTAPFRYAVTSGALPAGLSLSSSGTLSGTPSNSGSFAFTVTVTDSSTGNGPYTGTRAYALSVTAPTLGLTPTTLPTPAVDSAYSARLQASGGLAPYRFALSAGALPAGLTLSSSGTLSGRATAAGAFAFSITVTDSSSGAGPYQRQQAYAWTVAAVAQPALAVTATPTTLTSGGPGLTLASSGGAGSGAVTYAASGSGVVCTVAGNTLSARGGSGLCRVTATKAGDAGHTAITSPGIDVSVASAVQAPLTLRATRMALVSGDAGTALATSGGSGQGAVTYVAQGDGVSCTIVGHTLTAGGGAGRCTVSASKAAEGNYAAATAPAIVVTVSRASQATLRVSATPSSIVSGDAGTLLAGIGGSGSGALSFVAVGSGVQCHIAGSTLTASGDSGSCSVTASKAAQGDFAAAVSAPLTVSVKAAKAGTQLSLASTPRQPRVGQAVRLTATVSPATASGTVTFRDGAVTLGSAPLLRGTASIETQALTLGNHSLSASYDGDAGHTASVSSSSELAIAANPDPGADPHVHAQIDSQTGAVRQFSGAQMQNIGDRLRVLHEVGPEGFSNRLSLRSNVQSLATEPLLAGSPSAAASAPRSAGLPNTANESASRPQANLADDAAFEAPFSVWTSGVISFGNVSSNGRLGENRFRTSGVSAGADMRVDDKLRAGLAIGYGDDRTDLGDNSEHHTGTSQSAAVYAGYRLLPTTFVDALVGYGRGHFTSRRWVPDAGESVVGHRSADIVFGSIALVGEQGNEQLAWSPYLRLEFQNARLRAYSETGNPLWTLSYDRATTASTSAVLGLRGQIQLAGAWQAVTPTWGIEVKHQFDGSDTQQVSYASAPATRYSVLSTVGVQDSVTGSLGLKLNTDRGLTGSVEYSQSRAGGGLAAQGLRATLEQRF